MSTKEEAFFGIRNDVTSPAPELGDDVEIEFVDDTPEEDQPYTKPTAIPEEVRDATIKEASETETEDVQEENNSEEIKNVSSRVEKRIKKLRREFHEERRAKEVAERLSDEAIKATKKLHEENQRLMDLVKMSQSAVTNESKSGTQAAVDFAEQRLRQAHESGDPEQISAAQKRLTDAQIAHSQYHLAYNKVIDEWKQNAPPPQPEPVEQQHFEVPQPDPKALEWQERNDWFGSDAEMTSFAYGVHDKIVSEGVDPDTDEYYQLIDSRMRQVFPDQFSSETVVEDEAPRTKANSVVAPAKRGSKGSPRKITLTSTQLRLAKRLGLTPQQYAAQLLKETS
jgi:hypothetical protein